MAPKIQHKTHRQAGETLVLLEMLLAAAAMLCTCVHDCGAVNKDTPAAPYFFLYSLNADHGTPSCCARYARKTLSRPDGQNQESRFRLLLRAEFDEN